MDLSLTCIKTTY